ncbi:cysteine desulfurase [Ruficoccus amylovorans]|uniref:cysteine desulfurase n=1 Tax=Ruficoccus amylovorans TaxID=1804625 RepID=A0A842HFT4_9BACT|nr:cysteine desulfurase [Ruficoccus amylovorans]MBC2594496.1 cysteine desulfurase [Ruficoccus amylovorans]
MIPNKSNGTALADHPEVDVAAWRKDFPILAREVNGKPLVYLDNAASAQKPLAVIERIERYYSQEHANIHRGVHFLSQEATGAYEAARETVARYFNAAEARECIFTRGATEAINLVASTWGEANLHTGDEILLTVMEHHANIVPWQLLESRLGVKLVVAPVSDAGELLIDEWEKLIGPRTKLVALCHASNSLGTINPAKELIAKAHAHGIPVLLDGAQSSAHLKIDVRDLDCDWFVCSGHKLFGPTGIGVLYGKAELLGAMPPYQGGGDMIERVSFSGTTFRGLPELFEAGTPNIAGAIGLAAALDYVESIGHPAIAAQEADLLAYATAQLEQIEGLTIYGRAARKVALISFNIAGIHPNDIGTMLDSDGIAVRTGHHCTMPLWERFGLTGTARASFAFYNTRQEIDALVASLNKLRKLFLP